MDYVVGSVAALISGNVTPNRPKLIRRALTPTKHQLSPNVTPKSELVEDRSIFLSPTLQKKKAIVKKSPKRIFQNPDLDSTEDCDTKVSTSPKADKVKKHLKDELDGDAMPKKKSLNTNSVNESSDKSLNEVSPKKKSKHVETASVDNTPRKKKKHNSESNDSNIPEMKQGDSAVECKSPKKTKQRRKSVANFGNNDDKETINSQTSPKISKLNDEADETKSQNVIKKNKKRKKDKTDEAKSELETVSDLDESEQKPKKKKNKKTKTKEATHTEIKETENDSDSENERMKNIANPNAITEKDTDSEHDSDNDAHSENEEENEDTLKHSKDEPSSDEDNELEATPKTNKNKPDKDNNEQMSEEEVKRTLFVGNVPFSNKCKKEIKKIFSQYGQIETVRIRTVPVKDARVTPKLAVIKNEIHPERSTVNVYVKYADEQSVVKALSANNTVLNNHHLRVTRSVTTGAEHDPKLAIFVGNLPFGIEDESLRAKFQGCGEIESVRVVRDKKTNAGKGFGYVNFATKDGVELALAMTEEDLTMKNRILRVKRCTQSGSRGIKAPNNKKFAGKWGRGQNQRQNEGRSQGKTQRWNQDRGQNRNQRNNDGKNWPQKNSDGKNWPQKNNDGKNWPQKNNDGKNWPQKNNDGKNWPQKNNDGKNWPQKNNDGKNWPQKNNDGKNWPQKNNDGKNWPQKNNDGKNWPQREESGAARRLMHKRKLQETPEGPANKKQNVSKEKKPKKEFVGITAEKKKKHKFNKDAKKKKALSEILTKKQT